MAKIIKHDFNEKMRTPREDLLTSSFHFFMQGLEDKKALIGEMVMQARLFLAQEGMPPGEFVISETYLREVLHSPFPRMEGGEDNYDELVYLRQSGDCITALCQFAVPGEEGVTISYQIYRLESISTGKTRWNVYNFQSGEWMEDEDDCFNLKAIRHDIDRFYDMNRKKKSQ